VSGDWAEVGDGVFARRYQPWDVTVGVVVGTAGVMVVDTRSTAAEGQQLRADVRRLDHRAPRWVVNTHDHFDHVAGNLAFTGPGAEAGLWGHPSLAATVSPPPSHPVERAVNVDLGDRTVVLRHLGPAHTAGDVVVTVAGAGVTFAGDLVEESGPPSYGDDSFPLEWPLAAARLVGLLREGDRVVPGHGRVVDRGFVVAQQRALAEAARAVRDLWVGEVPVDGAVEEARARWPFPPTFVAAAVRRAYALLDLSAQRGSGG
jgi:glyoxylase-like metal-dependent hydrolase (beta-lactamase superfamily II)